jgi:hypothetical protein
MIPGPLRTRGSNFQTIDRFTIDDGAIAAPRSEFALSRAPPFLWMKLAATICCLPFNKRPAPRLVPLLSAMRRANRGTGEEALAYAPPAGAVDEMIQSK